MTAPPTAPLWVAPEPATRTERLVAVSTVSAIGLMMVLAILHLALTPYALIGVETAEWGFADFSYLLLMVHLSALTLVPASLREDVPRSRTMIALACTIGLVGTVLTLAKGWFMLIGLLYADEDWKTYVVLGATVISLLPFVLPFASGVILLRNDFEPVRWRVRAISIIVASTVAVIAVAALLPRWARFAELGIW